MNNKGLFRAYKGGNGKPIIILLLLYPVCCALCLQLRHMPKDSILFLKQFFRSSLLSYNAMIQDNDFIRSFDRTHPVCNHQNCLARKQS